MKKTALSVALAAPLALTSPCSLAQMFVNPNGTGEVLLYPFYSAARGNDTYVHVINKTNLVKAVKVRFREAHNGATAYEFNLYLSPADHWSAAITLNSDGAGGVIRTIDQSCTVPALGTSNPPFDGSIQASGELVIREQPFTNFGYLEDAPNDGLERTLQGFVEIIEMGQMRRPNFSPTSFPDDFDASDDANDKPLGAIHGFDGIPYGCTKLVNAWHPTDGAWTNNQADELISTWNGGGLFGYSTLINVEDGTAAGFDAIAIERFFDPAVAAGTLHTAPNSSKPDLADGVSTLAIPAEEGMTAYTMNSGIDAVSALFMSQTIRNDYVAASRVRARTDWIMTQPTRQFYVDSEVKPPYTTSWNGTAACESVALNYWDREAEEFEPPSGGTTFSIRPPFSDPADSELCTQVTAIGFGTDSAVRADDDIYYGVNGFLGAFSAGFSEVDFSMDEAHALSTANGGRFFGLPFIGYAVITYRNDDANAVTPGVLASYASATEHKRTRLFEPGEGN